MLAQRIISINKKKAAPEKLISNAVLMGSMKLVSVSLMDAIFNTHLLPMDRDIYRIAIATMVDQSKASIRSISAKKGDF